MKKIQPTIVLHPDTSKISRFLIPPVVFSIISCILVVMFAGINFTGFLAALIITLCVCLPFVVLILPTFLFEKITLESFTVTFYFIFLVFRFKKSIPYTSITKIRQQYRDNKKNGQREILVEYLEGTVIVSESKYTKKNIQTFLDEVHKRNPGITINRLP